MTTITVEETTISIQESSETSVNVTPETNTVTIVEIPTSQESDPIYLADKPSIALKTEVEEVSTQLGNKVDKETGKGLSSNDFTTVLKNAYDAVVNWIATNGANILNHLSNTDNPHSVTKTQVGLENVDNTSDEDKPISNATQTALDGKQATLQSGVNIKTVNNQSLLGNGNIDIGGVGSINWGDIGGTITEQSDLIAVTDGIYEDLNTHISDNNNPHGVNSQQVGLGMVDNTPDIEKPVSNPQQQALDLKADKELALIYSIIL